MNHLDGIERLEARLWKVTGDLRGNSLLASNECFMSILGLLFLRQGSNRYYEALAGIAADKVAGKIAERDLIEADFPHRRAMMLPETTRNDTILERTMDGTLGAALTNAIAAVEAPFLPLAGQLPKDCEPLEDDLLEQILRTLDTEGLQTASRDMPGRICEYFLADLTNPQPSAAGRQAYLSKASGSLASAK